MVFKVYQIHSPSPGLSDSQKAQYGEELQSLFKGKRTHAVDPPAFLDHKGCELFLTAHKVFLWLAEEHVVDMPILVVCC